MNDLYMFLILFIVNSVVSVLYGIYMWKKDEFRERAVFGGLIIFLTLGIGAIFFFISAVVRLLFRDFIDSKFNYEEVSFRKTKVFHASMEDVDKARDIIPIEEAAIIANKYSARSYFLNLLKDDYGNYIKPIYEAIQNPDSEISHYAATAIVDIVAAFKSEFPIDEDKVKKTVGVEQFLKRSTEFLSYNILSDTDLEYYSNELDRFASNQSFTENVIYYMTEMYLKQEAYDKADVWIKRLPKECGITGYKSQLHYYFKSNQKEKFQNKLNELKQNDVALDQQILDLVRIYS